ncbi:hypothetical protein [Photobacterium kishitanii]|uniref:hypothetical protein n=1 Tax=Photobacterium kishitanii TaxID=318456 RepID=UPI0011B22EF8|nr:hypothetical protein [Photobacterium kishitanii]
MNIRSRNPYICLLDAKPWSYPAFIASQMGHKDMTMVLKVYGTWMPSGNESEIEKMEMALR